MYFPTSSATKLASEPGLPQRKLGRIICLCPSPRRSLFCTLTVNGVSVWRVRPSTVLAQIVRTPLSVQEHGENESIHWSPDGSTLVISTSNGHLIVIRVHYSLNPAPYHLESRLPSLQALLQPGPGEAIPLQRIELSLEGVIQIEGGLQCLSARKSYILFATRLPPTVQRMSWPTGSGDRVLKEGSEHRFIGHETWTVANLPWLWNADVLLTSVSYSERDDAEVWITSDGCAYFVHLDEQLGDEPPQDQVSNGSRPSSSWQGILLSRPSMSSDSSQTVSRKATKCAINMVFSLIALGTESGEIEVIPYPSLSRAASHAHSFKPPDISYRSNRGQINAMEWSSDGCVLTVGWEQGWALWSVGGRCLVWGFEEGPKPQNTNLRDLYFQGVQDFFWGNENTELILLAYYQEKYGDDQLYIIPFAKSAAAAQQSPDNTRYAVLHLDDRIMVYRGADQPDMSIINPESDVWQYIKVPSTYMASNWPIRYTAISSDGRLLAVAGRRGLAHYSVTSGRWKTFREKAQEQAFVVIGGMVWFHHVLIAAVEVANSYQLRLFSRDLDLSTQAALFRELLSAAVVLLSLVDNTLLVYTADNVLLHYLIIPTDKTIKLHLCGSINFEGVIAVPGTVRCLSWMIPSAQKQFGDPTEDLSVATILMLVGGRLVLLRPRKSGSQEVKYDMQIMADWIEFCWIHLRGIGTLENSLWGYDGRNIRVWLDALTIEAVTVDPNNDGYESVEESVHFTLDFYPLSVLMDKGIVLGAESEHVIRSNLSFVQFRTVTSTYLFLQDVLRYHLELCHVEPAVQFASHYSSLVYFAHALEVLLHSVLETNEIEHTPTAGDEDAVLRSTVAFLDHFDHSLDVVVGCARKTEMERWPRLFGVVGNPKRLFETCLSSGQLKTASSYLLILHNMEQLEDDHSDAVRLITKAIGAKDWQLCRDILRFLKSIDASNEVLAHVLRETNLLTIENGDLQHEAGDTQPRTGSKSIIR